MSTSLQIFSKSFSSQCSYLVVYLGNNSSVCLKTRLSGYLKISLNTELYTMASYSNCIAGTKIN